MAIAHVQSHATGVGATGTSVNLAFGSNTTAGNAIMVGWRYAGGVLQTPVLTDGTNTYTSNAVQGNDTADGAWCGIGFSLNIAGGAVTVNFATVNSNTKRMGISEFSGVATSSALDKTAGTNGTGTAVAAGSVTPTTDGQLFFAVMQNPASTTITAGTDFTIRTDVSTRVATESYVQPTAAAHDFTFTQGDQSWACAGATFIAAGGATPVLTLNSIERRVLRGVGRGVMRGAA